MQVFAVQHPSSVAPHDALLFTGFVACLVPRALATQDSMYFLDVSWNAVLGCGQLWVLARWVPDDAVCQACACPLKTGCMLQGGADGLRGAVLGAWGTVQPAWSSAGVHRRCSISRGGPAVSAALVAPECGPGLLSLPAAETAHAVAAVQQPSDIQAAENTCGLICCREHMWLDLLVGCSVQMQQASMLI